MLSDRRFLFFSKVRLSKHLTFFKQSLHSSIKASRLFGQSWSFSRKQLTKEFLNIKISSIQNSDSSFFFPFLLQIIPPHKCLLTSLNPLFLCLLVLDSLLLLHRTISFFTHPLFFKTSQTQTSLLMQIHEIDLSFSFPCFLSCRSHNYILYSCFFLGSLRMFDFLC